MAVDNLKVPKEDVQVLLNNPEAVRRMFEEGFQNPVDEEFAKHMGRSRHERVSTTVQFSPLMAVEYSPPL